MEGMKVIKNTTIYKCKHCSKIYVRKFYAKKHHLRCKENPENKGACHWCANLEYKEFEIECSFQGMDSEEKRKSFYCNKKDIFLKPRWSVSDIDAYFCDTPTVEKMPLKCDDWSEMTF